MKIYVVGLGYVGLPLFVELTKYYDHVFGYDISHGRIKELKEDFIDRTGEVSSDRLEVISLNNGKAGCEYILTDNYWDLEWSDIFIVTVPTPIDQYKKPDLGPIKLATEQITEFPKTPSRSVVLIAVNILKTAH